MWSGHEYTRQRTGSGGGLMYEPTATYWQIDNKLIGIRLNDCYIVMNEHDGEISNVVVGALNQNNEVAHLIKTC